MTLSKGDDVEVCPFRKGGARSYPALAELDGCSGVVSAAPREERGEQHVQVDVEAAAKDRRGHRYLPVRALKPI